MSTNTIFHSQIPVHCCSIIKQFLNGRQYFRDSNKYFIPFYCQNINQKNRVLSGNFVYPMWNPLRKAILYNSKSFTYSFFKTADLTVEIKHNDLEMYHIFSSSKMYPVSIQLSSHDIYKDSYLLFTLDKDVAELLIHKNLL